MNSVLLAVPKTVSVVLVSGGWGALFYEVVTGRAMFPGSTVKEELHLIFRLMGMTTDLRTHTTLTQKHKPSNYILRIAIISTIILK